MGADLRCIGIRNYLKQAIQSGRFKVQKIATVKCDVVQSGRDVPMSSVDRHDHMNISSHSL
jgi:hypothetical protein